MNYPLPLWKCIQNVPNTDGRWLNGKLDHEALNDTKIQFPSDAQLEAERRLATEYSNSNNNNLVEFRKQPKPMAQYLRSGGHGTIYIHRNALAIDQQCTASGKVIEQYDIHYSRGYRQATFCPCPCGDSPSAKRMYDSLHGECIPIVLSHDFVWPLTVELIPIHFQFG